MKKISAILFLCLLIISPAARAHYLWLETPEAEGEIADTFRVYYGEYEEGVREKSGGKLEDVTAIELLSDSRNQGDQKASGFEKKDMFFEGNSRSAKSSGWIQIQELNRSVKDWAKYDIGIVKPNYYASAISPDAKQVPPPVPAEKTLLGIYPVKLGSETKVSVYFQDKPLAAAKVLVHAPNLWTKEWKTDEEGLAVLDLPWTGLYVFEVIHLEKTPGQFEEVPYEAIRHRATFAFEFKG